MPEMSPLPFLHLMQTLKDLPRTGWLRTIETPESVASHSFGLALLGGFAPPPLDSQRCMLIGLCHDLAESVVGDIPTYAGVPKEEKRKRESLAFEYIANLVRPCSGKFADELMDLWEDYEHGRTPEGRFMKEMDKFECLTQAFGYEQHTFGEKPGLEEFQGLTSKIKSPEALGWLRDLQRERAVHFDKRQRRLPVIFVTGDLTASKAISGRLAEDFGWSSVCIRDILLDASRDQSCPHAHFIQESLQYHCDIPAGLVISLLEPLLTEDRWIIVQDFLLDHMVAFERQVQKTNFIIHLTHQSGLTLGCSNPWNSTYYRELSLGSEEEIYMLAKKTTEEFLEAYRHVDKNPK
ncbi:hypothetical protein FJTKL_08825 [Diaporthe vaccinii]|uniref:5'-deoxynucleotidase n=1 Tax=Diaporthe vaccinii TaxID=105482 RepID=A0ABR4EPQ8_9PEZI